MGAKRRTCVLCQATPTCIVAIRHKRRLIQSVYTCADHGRQVADSAKAKGNTAKVSKLKMKVNWR